MYSVDTNIFIDWWERRYPPDVFPSIQKAIESLATSARFVAPERVREEIEASGSKGLKTWAKNNKAIFVPHDTQIQTEANQIQYAYPDLIDTGTPFDEADRWVIALARVKGFTVVTHETSVKVKKRPDRKLYIPDVCRSMNIPCIELIELMRREKWSF